MKMHRSIRGSSLLVGVCLLVGTGALAQRVPGAANQSQVSTDLAVTYATERAELAPGKCGCFWLQGGGVDAAVTFWKGLGVAASFNGGHASKVAPGEDVNKIEFAGGPRYTFTVWERHPGSASRPRFQFFGQGLFGAVHAFNGVFPGAKGTAPSAGSSAIEAGGGMNLLLTRNFGVRLLEIEYVRTALPNNASNTQNDLRLAFGATWRLGKR
jgi:hypothetical protein